MITDTLKGLLSSVELNESTTLKKIQNVEKEMNLKFPQEYIDILLFSNGFTGSIGEKGWFELWKIEELVENNKMYKFSTQLPGILIIGSNQGGFNYGIDLRTETPHYIMVDPIDMKDTLFFGGNTFEELLNLVGKGELTKIEY